MPSLCHLQAEQTPGEDEAPCLWLGARSQGSCQSPAWQDPALPLLGWGVGWRPCPGSQGGAEPCVQRGVCPAARLHTSCFSPMMNRFFPANFPNKQYQLLFTQGSGESKEGTLAQRSRGGPQVFLPFLFFAHSVCCNNPLKASCSHWEPCSAGAAVSILLLACPLRAACGGLKPLRATGRELRLRCKALPLVKLRVGTFCAPSTDLIRIFALVEDALIRILPSSLYW